MTKQNAKHVWKNAGSFLPHSPCFVLILEAAADTKTKVTLYM